MTDMQGVLIKLLDEIDSLCKENNLKYFLGYEAALSGYRDEHFNTEMSSVTLFMPFNDIIKLRKIIRKKKQTDRCLDSMLDNPRYPNFTFRYSDESTLYYNLKDNYKDLYKSHGIFIKICVLRRLSGGRAATIANDMEAGWYYNTPDYNIKNARAARIKRICGMLIRHCNALYRKIFFKLFSRTQKNASCDGVLAFKAMDGRVTRFPEGLFSRSQQITLEGKKYIIPYNADDYFRLQYSFNWRNQKFAKVSIGESFIVDTELPYAEYFDYLKNNNISCDFDIINKKQENMKLEMKRTNVPIDDAWRYVRRSAARFKMWELYMPQKEKIISLYDNQQWEELDKLLAEYDEVVHKFIANNLTVYFDKDIFEVYTKRALMKGQNDLVNALENNIPECHLKSIDL